MSMPTQAFERVLDKIKNAFPDFDYQPQILVNMRLMRVITAESSAYINQILSQYEINDTMWYALTILYGQDGEVLLPSELSRILDLTRTSATRLSDELLRRGWMTREASAIDRRSVHLTLSDSGKKIVEELLPKLANARIELWQDLTENEIETINQLLKKLIQRIKQVQHRNND